VVWEDVTKVPTAETQSSSTEESAASRTPVVLGVVPQSATTSAPAPAPAPAALVAPISDTNEAFGIVHAPTPVSSFDIPDEVPAATNDSLIGISNNLVAATVTVASTSNTASHQEVTVPRPETEAEAWARVEREVAVAARAETVEKLIRKSIRVKQEVEEHVAQDSRTRAKSKTVASSANPAKLIKAAKRSRMCFNLAVN